MHQRRKSRRLANEAGFPDDAGYHLLAAGAPGAPGRRFSASSGPSSYIPALNDLRGGVLMPAAADAYGYGPEADDALHAPDPPGYRAPLGAVTARGLGNVLALVVIVCGLLALFTAYPILTFVESDAFRTLVGNNIRINASGQAAVLINIPPLVDPATPQAARTRTGYDGQAYNLVFSDEFNTDNRSFYPGDDPYWEAVDIWYGATLDMEWYDPSQVTTGGGYLRILLEEVDPVDNHNLSLKSGMLQSWNKLCFSGGAYIEISAQLPGDPTIPGYWPGAWMMGNLGRPGFAATTQGLWPYSYDSCDIGTLANQTTVDGTGPALAFNLPPPYGRPQFFDQLSMLPGQRLSACTCSGEDHPGPTTGGRLRGRGAPEIDILEAERCKTGIDPHGCVSQSAQFAPFSSLYAFPTTEPAIKFWQTDNLTALNAYRGSALQQAISALTKTPDAVYGGNGGGQQFGTFGFEYFADEADPTQSFITWVSNGLPTYSLTGAAVGPDPSVDISQRLITAEPMTIILNLAVSATFQVVDLATMSFPAELLIDYVRVYQRADAPPSAVGCDPPGYPTTDYIAKHINAYLNPNLTSWEAAGYGVPKNSMKDGCT